MQENPTVLEGILDIEPPAMPILYALELNAFSIIFVSLIVIALLLISTFLFWRRYFSVRGLARRRLATLQNYFKKQQLENHHTAFELSNILREGLSLKQLSNRTTLPEKLRSHNDRWRTFLDRLSIARYSPKGYEPEQVALLFEDAEVWLSCWPGVKND